MCKFYQFLTKIIKFDIDNIFNICYKINRVIRTESTGGEKKSLTKDTSLLKNWEKPVILVFIWSSTQY